MLLRHIHRFHTADPSRHGRARPLFLLPTAHSPRLTARHHSRRAFTVLELLMVVGVLSILLAIIVPTIRTVHAAALRKRAQAEATALAQAAVRYKTEYGFWPGQIEIKDLSDGTVKLREEFAGEAGIIHLIASGPKTFTDNLKTTDGARVVTLNTNEVCQAFSRVGEKQGTAHLPNPLNPKGIYFLDLAGEDVFQRVGYTDPWGRSYILFMGLNPRSIFTHTITAQGSGTPTHTVSVSNTIAFAFSLGPEGDRSTNYIYSAGVR